MNARRAWVQRPLCFVALFYMLGIILARYAAVSAAFALGAAAVCLTALLVFFKRRAFPLALAFFFLLGFSYARLCLSPRLPDAGRYQMEATVAGETGLKNGKAKVRLQAVSLVRDGNKQELSSAYWTYYPKKGAFPLYDGQRLRFDANLYHPRGQENPYGFDFRMYLLQKGMGIGLSGAKNLEGVDGVRTTHQRFVPRLRASLSRRLDQAFGASSGLPKALLMGAREGIDEDITQDFRRTGLAHVLAISGLHVGILAGMLLFVLRRLRLPLWAQTASAAVFLLAYCVFLDFSASVTRASVLMMTFLLARLQRRRRDPLTQLALAALIVLLIRPLDLFSLGFQLSFLAVLGIFVMGDTVSSFLLAKLPPRSPGAVLLRLYMSTLSAALFTLPVIANAFHRVPAAALLAGPFACLAVGVLMGAYLLVLGLSLVFPWAGSYAAGAVNILSGVFLKGVAFVSAWPLSSLRVPRIPIPWVLTVYLAVLLLSRYTLLKRTAKATVCCAALALSVLFSVLTVQPHVRYLLFQSGRADAAVIEDGRHTVLIDAGKDGYDLCAYLLSTGRRADALFISHLHMDHIGGLERLMAEEIPIGAIYVAEGCELPKDTKSGKRLLGAARAAGIPVRTLTAGDRYEAGRLSAEAVWPHSGDADAGRSANDSSLGLLWRLDGATLLTLGDLTSAYEMNAALGADILKVSHHGIKSSTSDEFIRAVSPKAALIPNSASYSPNAERVRKRFTRQGVPVFSTDEAGALIVTVKNDKLSVKAYYTGEERTVAR